MIKTVESPFKTTIYHILPRVTTTLTENTSKNSNSPLLVFIPGNPGFIQYYTKYLDLLSSTTGYEILGISQAGFCTDDPHSRKVYSLEQQIQHKIDLIDQFVKVDGIHNQNNEREVYIFGHSVGSWMMQRIVERTSHINYKFIGFITPTIVDIHKSTKGQVLYPIVNKISWFYKLVGNFSAIVGLLPSSLVEYLVEKFVNTEFIGAKQITKEFIANKLFVEQSLALATEEMLTIQSDWEYQESFFDSKTDQSHIGKAHKWIFFASPDHWVHDETQKSITELLQDKKNISINRDDTIRHSFCISQSEIFAEITLKAINH